MKPGLVTSLFALTIGITGLVLLYQVDWRIALGVFLLLWCNNIDSAFRGRK